MWYWTTSHCFYYASSFQGLNSKNFSHLIILFWKKYRLQKCFTQFVWYWFLHASASAVSGFLLFFGFNLKSTCLQQQHYLYFSHQLKYFWMQILRNELIRYPFTFLCSWLRLQYNFVGTRISSMLVDYLLPIKGASSSIYIPAWVVVDQVDLCPRSFTQQETAPAVQRSGQRPDLNLEFLWKFVTSRMLIKKVSGGAGLWWLWSVTLWWHYKMSRLVMRWSSQEMLVSVLHHG